MEATSGGTAVVPGGFGILTQQLKAQKTQLHPTMNSIIEEEENYSDDDDDDFMIEEDLGEEDEDSNSSSSQNTTEEIETPNS